MTALLYALLFTAPIAVAHVAVEDCLALRDNKAIAACVDKYAPTRRGASAPAAVRAPNVIAPSTPANALVTPAVAVGTATTAQTAERSATAASDPVSSNPIPIFIGFAIALWLVGVIVERTVTGATKVAKAAGNAAIVTTAAAAGLAAGAAEGAAKSATRLWRARFKQCPYCKSTIHREATACKHCARWV